MRPLASSSAPPTPATTRGAPVIVRPTSIPRGECGHQQRTLDRAVPPDLDRQQDAEEQRADEGGEDEAEPDVGEDDVDEGRPGRAVDPAFVVEGANRRVDQDHERQGHDGRLDEEDRSPFEELGEHSAEGGADGRADRRRSGPPVAGPSLAAADRGQDGERTGEQQRRPDPLGAPRDQEDR